MTVAQFAPTPYEITKCGDPFAVIVWNAIRQYHQINVNGGKWVHNMVFYAKELQISVETVRRKIHFLIKKGFLKRERRNSYQFGYNYEIPEEWLCLTEEQLIEYRKHRKVTAKMSKKSSKKSEAEKPKNFAQNLELGASETHDFDGGYIKQDSIKKEFIKKEREILEDKHTFNIDEFQVQEDSKPEILVEKPILRSEIQTNNKNLNDDKSSEVVARDKRLGLPKGDWLDEETGDFKEGFLKWRTAFFMKFPNVDTELEARRCARKNFYNRPEELPLHWYNYQEEFNFRAENAQTRLNHGCELRQEEKEKLGQMMSDLNLIPQQEVLPQVEFTAPVPIEIDFEEEVEIEEVKEVETETETVEVVQVVETKEETVSNAVMKNIFNGDSDEQEQPSRFKSLGFIINEEKCEKQAIVEEKKEKREVKVDVLTDEFGNGAVIKDFTGLANQVDEKPTNWRSKFNFGLMGLFKSLGGEKVLGMRMIEWCKTPEVTTQFVAWAKAKNIVEECLAYERYYNLETEFKEE